MTKFELTHLLDYSDESIIAEMKRVASLIAKQKLTSRDFDKLSKVHSSGIRRRFGGWKQALVRAGMGDRYSGAVVTDKMKLRCGRRLTSEEMIAELIRVAEELGTSRFVKQQFDARSTVSSDAVSRRFGSWSKAMISAGLVPGTGAMRYTEEDYFENLLTVWTHYGRQPKHAEMDEKPSRISSGAYEYTFGKWSNALRAFISRMEQDLGEERAPAEGVHADQLAPVQDIECTSPSSNGRTVSNTTGKPEDRRDIPLGLRFKVLQRDRYRCVICGDSPSKNLTCDLHADHIVPFSKGGKTTIENLQILCAACNLGKGNRTETTETSP